MLQRIPLTAKVLLAATMTALTCGYALNYYSSQHLRSAYESELLSALKQQAHVDRMRFDELVKGFSRNANITASYMPMLHYLKQHSGATETNDATKNPIWLPRKNELASGVLTKLVLVVDNSNQVLSRYTRHLEHVPEIFNQAPPMLYRLNSTGQTMMTMIDNQPWLLATAIIRNVRLESMGYVMFGAPMDEDFLDYIQLIHTVPSISAIVGDGSNGKVVLISSDSDLVPPGSAMQQIQKRFLVTGQDFFDYGASDLPVQFISLRQRSWVDAQMEHVLSVANWQRNTQSIVIMLILVLCLLWLTRRMRKVSSEIRQFTHDHLDIDIANVSADSMIQLEHHVTYLEKRILEFLAQERESVNLSLRDTKLRFQEFFNHVNEIVFVFSRKGQMVHANPACLQKLGYVENELQYLNVRDLIQIDSSLANAQFFRRLLRTRQADNLKTELVSKQGEKIVVEGSAYCHIDNNKLSEIYVLFQNVSEQEEKLAKERKHQEQMEHTQRLESLGVLAGGIAHDFNNLLTAIMGNAAIAAKKLEEEPYDARQRLEKVVQTSERAAELCSQMLAYSGKGSFVIEPIDLTSTVQEISTLLSVSIHKQIDFVVDLPEQPLMVEGDATQLQQIIMNLITNANEAIGDQYGRISLKLDEVYVDKAFLDQCIDCQTIPGNYVKVEVHDTGCGMDENTISKIFEPFFTTKFTGRGLGMSAMLGIVRAHHGVIHVLSTPGEGTVFKVLFPVLKTGNVVNKLELKGEEVPQLLHQATVLVVDDEDGLRELASILLIEAGCKVLLAADGEEALYIFSQHHEEINLVLLDLTMPKMSGEQCFLEMSAINVNVPVMITSGYSVEDIKKRFHTGEIVGVIHKPYHPDYFMQEITPFII